MTALAQQNQLDIGEIARLTLQQADGDALKAVAMLEEHAQRDVNVANALVMPLLRQACYDAIRSVCKQERRHIWKVAENDNLRHNQEGAARVVSHGRRLMDFLLPHGAIRVGEATQAELMQAVEFYRKQARTELQRARWLELVAEHVSGRRKVKNAVDEDTLKALFKKAVESV